MKFWDTSALVPLLTQEEATAEMTALFSSDRNLMVAFMRMRSRDPIRAAFCFDIPAPRR